MMTRKTRSIFATLLIAIAVTGCYDLRLTESDSMTTPRAVSAAFTTSPGFVNQIVTYGDKSALFRSYRQLQHLQQVPIIILHWS